MRKLLSLLLCLTFVQAHAGERTQAENDEIIAKIMAGFWEHAFDTNGEPFQPDPNLDRNAVPVPMSIAYQAIDAGKTAGKASRCLLRFMPHYRAITASARELGMTETQISFISALYGEKLSRVARSRVRCTTGDQRLAESHLEASMRVGLTAP